MIQVLQNLLNFLDRSSLPLPLVTVFLLVVDLLGEGGLGEPVLVDPLSLPVQLVTVHRNSGDMNLPELHPLGHVLVPDLMVLVSLVAHGQVVGVEYVKYCLNSLPLLFIFPSDLFLIHFIIIRIFLEVSFTLVGIVEFLQNILCS